jgi:hypothetical protein
MRINSRPGRGRKLLVGLIVAGAAFGVATAVQASIPDSNAIVHACYNTSNLNGYPNGALRAIDTAKVNGRCFAGEAPVDLATPQYVQNVVTSTVNQTAIMGSFTFTGLAANNWRVQWTCGGWVATTPTVSIDPPGGGTSGTPITLHGSTNAEQQSGAFPGTTVWIWFTLASTQNLHSQVTCVDPRVYGETAPVAAPARPTATISSS